MRRTPPILMIGLDAAEVEVIQKLCSQGVLPALESLKRKGCFGLLNGQGDLFMGGVWPSFYTSQEVPWHGVYHNKMWRQEHMRCEVPREGWLPVRPFWQLLDLREYRVAILDVPMTVGVHHSANGTQVAGWGTHDSIAKGAWPPHLWNDLHKAFGPPQMPTEWWGPQSPGALLRLRHDLLKATAQMADVSVSLMDQGAWDLFCVVFGATHRAGHYFWDLSRVDSRGWSEEKLHLLDGALVEIYQACDRAVARLIEKAPPGAKILVFSVHGMGPHTSCSEVAKDILARIQERRSEAPAKTGAWYRLREALPRKLIRQVTTRLPNGIHRKLIEFWSTNMFDWRTTRYFALPSDGPCYIRINLKGREPEGVVEQQQEYEAICKELEAAFLSFSDARGTPVVQKVYRPRDLAPPEAPCCEVLPDLIVRWNDYSTGPRHGIRSEQYGEMHWESGGCPSGRSGFHRNKGWFVAVGDGIQPDSTAPGDHRTLDLVPTVFQWLGARRHPDFQGKPIPELSGNFIHA